MAMNGSGHPLPACRSLSRDLTAWLRSFLLPLLLLLLLAVSSSGVGVLAVNQTQCQTLRILTPGGAEQQCRQFYNTTQVTGNSTYSVRSSLLNMWAAFINQPRLFCHRQLALFVCASYFPVCDPETGVAMYPCADFCLQLEEACRDLLRASSVFWSFHFNCSDSTKYVPMSKNSSRCLEMPVTPTTSLQPTFSTTVASNVSTGPRIRPCQGDYYFQEPNRSFVTWWVAIWSVLCFISSLVTVATFFMDRERFNYPEKPIVFLSLSYSVFSLTFIVRLIVGDTAIVCSGDHLVDTGVNSGPCTIIALLLYFVWMASYSWWLILTLTWLLAAGFKWGTEAIAKYSTVFHIFAWGAPAIKTIILVATEHVDADELARVCSVGNFDNVALLGFVVVPISVYLCVGTIFIVIGIVSLIRIRSLIKHGGRSTQKLEQLIVRIGILSVFYTGPASVVLGIYAYEYADRSHWSSFCTEEHCKPACTGDSCARPVFAVFVVKYFMLLVVGVTSSVWIWSGKTVASWRRFVKRLRRKSKEADLNSRQTGRNGRPSMNGSYKPNPTNGSVHRGANNFASVSRVSQAPTHSVTQV